MNQHRGRSRWLGIAPLAMVVAWALFAATQPALAATTGLKAVSHDPYTNPTSYHKTQVEPDTFSYGNTIVSAFQVGRFRDGGSSNIGWATQTVGGRWKHGFLPGTTVYAQPVGTYARISDPSVAYDLTHKTWLIASLALDASLNGVAVLVSRSANGVKWSKPIVVAAAVAPQNWDKTWVVCDNTSAAFAGHCYIEWDDFGNLDQPHVATSTDGGLTWTDSSAPLEGADSGGQPVVQPTTGTVIMPIESGLGASIDAYVSHNGGATFSGPVVIAQLSGPATVPGGIRAPDLPSADVDALGRVYVVWYDCTFEPTCAQGASSNDILMSTTLNGVDWTPPVAIPINPTGGGPIDSFLAGISVDPTTSGASAVLGVTYYYYTDFACTACKLNVGFISSMNGGLTWGTPTQLAGPIDPTWLPSTTQGYMVGDYNSLSFINGKAYTVFATAKAGTCQLGQITSCHENMSSPLAGLVPAGGAVAARTDALYHGLARPVGRTLALWR